MFDWLEVDVGEIEAQEADAGRAGVSRVQLARLEKARAALAAVQARVGVGREPGQAPTLPLADYVADILPTGLRRGHVVAVEGSTSLVLALVAQASREGAWMAMVGMPRIGVVAAARRGLDLTRLVLIPDPSVQAPAVVGACVDGMDVVVVGPRLALSPADRRRLVAHARERGSVIVSAGPWEGAHVSVVVEGSYWAGLGAGEGRLRSREVEAVVSLRSGGPARRVRVVLDGAGAGGGEAGSGALSGEEVHRLATVGPSCQNRTHVRKTY